MEEDGKSQSHEPACVASLVMLTCASNVGKWRSFAMTTRATALLALGLGPPMIYGDGMRDLLELRF
jgi:hypothetical protein